MGNPNMISIIIPIFNSASTLIQCLNSVLKQQYTDWECILVDDGSTDTSGSICDDWQHFDKRFKVIHQKNKGVSTARNKGIESCKGEYICFIDADDWVDSNFLSTMLEHLYDADLVVSGQIRERHSHGSMLHQPEVTEVLKLQPANADKFVKLVSLSLFYAPHEKLYRAELVKKHKICFPIDCSYGEDLLFNYTYLNYVQRISTINGAYYHYRISMDTLSTRYRKNQFASDYNQWKVLEEFHRRHGLLNENANLYLYSRLWGIIYDGIFLYLQTKNMSLARNIQEILNIHEIERLKEYKKTFICSYWIKWAILKRCCIVFILYKMIFK